MSDDAFDTADYYECLGDTDLVHVSIADAIEAAINHEWESPDDRLKDLISKIAPVTVVAWTRKTVTDEHARRFADELFEQLNEDAHELYGDREGMNAMWSSSESDTIRKDMTLVIRAAMSCADIWQCEEVGKREFTAEEMARIVGSRIAGDDS